MANREHAPCKYEGKSNLFLMQITAELLSHHVNYSLVCLLRKSEICENVGFDLIQSFFCTELWTLYTKFLGFFLVFFFNEILAGISLWALMLSLAVSAFEVTALNGPIWSSYARLITLSCSCLVTV